LKETLRILLVTPREGVSDAVEEAVGTQIDDYHLYWVSEPDLAIARAEEILPHVILVDDDMRGASPTSLIREVASRAPAAAILALVESHAMNQARQAVLAGARAFLAKPFRADELVASLRELLRHERIPDTESADNHESRGRVVVFCAPKGGTGRTTLAVNTAVSLAMEAKKPAVLVDADYASPSVDVVLNLHAQRDISDLLPKMSHLDEDLVAGVLTEHASGIQVLLAPTFGYLTSPVSFPQVQKILVVLKRMFSWVLVDLGLPLDEVAYAFLDGADRIVISMLPEMVGLRNTRLMLKQFRNRGYPEQKTWLVVNRASMRARIAPRDIEELLPFKIKLQIPDDQPLATYSINRGVPVAMRHRRSALGRGFRKLAQYLVSDLSEVAGATARRRAVRELGDEMPNSGQLKEIAAGQSGY